MKTRFLDGLTEDEQDQAKYEFEKAFRFRQQLKELLLKDIESNVTSMTKDEHFDSPSWALIQADRVAQIRAYKKIIGLLD